MMFKVMLIILTFIVIFTTEVVIGWSFFTLGTKSQAINTSAQINQEVTNQPTDEEKIKSLLPVNIKSPSVKGTSFWYTFTGTVREIKKNGKNVEILTDIQEEGLPKFLVTPETKVYFVKNELETATSAASIQTNQKVDISIPYKASKEAWDTVERIKILNP